jgi:Domain of unknown function (DUF397)
MDAPYFDPSRAVWRTSSFSNNGGACVEVADNQPDLIAVRDTKDRSGPILLLTPIQWREFITMLRANAVSVAG